MEPYESVVVLRQTGYIDKLARKFRIDVNRNVKVPIEPNKQLTKRLEAEPKCVRPYRELVGPLIYNISTCTRPDISFAVNKCAQHFADPAERHFDSAIKILSYLSTTRELGLYLGGRRDGLDLSVYADADFANDPDTRHSVTGNLLYLDGSLISWTSKKQKLVATSSTEAEFLAAFYTLRDIQCVEQFIRCVFPAKMPQIVLYQDNQSCIALISNESSKGRSKHFDVKLKALNASFRDRYFELIYCPTEEMVADIMTKALNRIPFSRFRPKLVD